MVDSLLPLIHGYWLLFKFCIPAYISTHRWTLEQLGSLELRRSALEDDFEEEEEKDEDEQLADGLDSGGNDKVQ